MDKDMKQTPNCEIYNFHYMHKTLFKISEHEARYNFWSQVLIGDSDDCVKGIFGYGKAKPPKIFKGCKTDFQYLRACYAEYHKKYKGKAREKMIETYVLVKLRDNVKTPSELNFNEI